MSTAYGNFHDGCRDTGSLNPTLPVCYLFNEATTRGGRGFGGCDLTGIPLSNDRHLANLGSILLNGVAIAIAAYLLLIRTNTKRAAVGRREMQLFLAGYIIISICEIFSVGGFPLQSRARRVFVAINIAAVTATTWFLLMISVVSFDKIPDSTFVSVGLVLVSGAALFIGTGYIALDTGFSWTGYFDSTLTAANNNRSYSLYTLYFLVPLVFLVLYFVLQSVIILKVLGTVRPMFYVMAAALVFALGQVFQFVISVHICNGTNGHINGGFFQVLCNILAVVLVWVGWNTITEDDWVNDAPMYRNDEFSDKDKKNDYGI